MNIWKELKKQENEKSEKETIKKMRNAMLIYSRDSREGTSELLIFFLR